MNQVVIVEFRKIEIYSLQRNTLTEMKMNAAHNIAKIINASTRSTGMTASVVDNKCIAHVPAQSSVHGLVYESVNVNTEAFAKKLIADMN